MKSARERGKSSMKKQQINFMELGNLWCCALRALKEGEREREIKIIGDNNREKVLASFHSLKQSRVENKNF